VTPNVNFSCQSNGALTTITATSQTISPTYYKILVNIAPNTQSGNDSYDWWICKTTSLPATS
jgi:predicted RNA binding protein with dsRBD fold (UPF0201 family)